MKKQLLRIGNFVEIQLLMDEANENFKVGNNESSYLQLENKILMPLLVDKCKLLAINERKNWSKSNFAT